jgi:hypothetical protein
MIKSNAFLIIALVMLLIPQNHLFPTLDKKITDMILDITKFCLNKPRDGFCSPEYIKLMINSAAISEGKASPISDISELELERQRALENLKLSREIEHKKKFMLKMEREKQRKLMLEKLKYQKFMNQLEKEKDTLSQIISGQNSFRY